MRVTNSLDNDQLESDLILTIGTFDGVHRGHEHLLIQLVRCARRTSRIGAVLTFDPHPRTVLHPGARSAYLTTPTERATILESLGIDLLVALPFTPKLASTPAGDFVAELTRKLYMRELWVGADFAMGYRRGGDVARLQGLSRQLGYTLRVVEPMYDGEQVISSSRIRNLLQVGQVSEAARLLGRLYSVPGRVIKGQQRGRCLGFRTANLSIDPQRVMPADGVYAVWARVHEERYQGVANVGVRPSFGGGERTLEIHLMEYECDLYGKSLSVEFVQRLRPELRFDDINELVAQIRQDVKNARILLGVIRVAGGAP